MSSKVWNVKFEDGRHTVELKRSLWTGKRTILVDGIEAPQGKKKSFMDAGGDIPVRVGTHDCVISIKSNGLTTSYDFIPDAEPQPSIPLPKWGWLFVGACLLMPIIALGGAIPVVVGFGGASLCYNIAKKEETSTLTRVGQCIAVTVVCWGIFLLMLMAVVQAAR